MGLFDSVKDMAAQAAAQAQDMAVQALDERAAAKEAARAEAAAYGKKLMTVEGETKGDSIILYVGGVEFTTRDEELGGGKRLWADISSIAIEDAEELQQRVTVTRLLLFSVFAFALKKKSGGTKYVTVEGEDFLWPMEVGRKRVKDAQKLVMKARALMKTA